MLACLSRKRSSVQIRSGTLSNGAVRKPEKRRSSNLRDMSVGSIPSRATFMTAKWWNWRAPTRSVGRRDTQNVVPIVACEFNSRLGYFLRQHCRCDRCPADRHKVGVLGSIPRPATHCKQRRGWASAQPGLISQDRRVRPPDPLLRWSSTQTGKAASMRGL